MVKYVTLGFMYGARLIKKGAKTMIECWLQIA